jgi:uncharacterized membrane protein
MMNRDRISRGRTSLSSNTTLGLDERLERVLLYPLSAVLAIFTPLGWLLALAVFLIEKNTNVRSHAAQAGVIFGSLSILKWLISLIGALLSHIPVLSWVTNPAFWFVGLILFWVIIALAIWLTIMVWFRPRYHLPVVGTIIDGFFAKWI